MEVAETKVERAEHFCTNEELIQHIKAVGHAIINDADKLPTTPGVTFSVSISAKIAPGEKVTSINYLIDRRADPRIPEATE